MLTRKPTRYLNFEESQVFGAVYLPGLESVSKAEWSCIIALVNDGCRPLDPVRDKLSLASTMVSLTSNLQHDTAPLGGTDCGDCPPDLWV
eukprot:3374865-Rhodomonas_salina.2